MQRKRQNDALLIPIWPVNHMAILPFLRMRVEQKTTFLKCKVFISFSTRAQREEASLKMGKAKAKADRGQKAKEKETPIVEEEDIDAILEEEMEDDVEEEDEGNYGGFIKDLAAIEGQPR